MEQFQLYDMESERLYFRRLRADDFALVAPILQDAETMYAWEHGFSYEEVIDWIADMLRRYREDGSGYLIAQHRQTGELIALAGPLWEALPGDMHAWGVGCIVRRDLWQQGYGKECIQASMQYAFSTLQAKRVVAVIRPDNLASLHAAAACGFRPLGTFDREYRGKSIPHVLLYVDAPLEPPVP